MGSGPLPRPAAWSEGSSGLRIPFLVTVRFSLCAGVGASGIWARSVYLPLTGLYTYPSKRLQATALPRALPLPSLFLQPPLYHLLHLAWPGVEDLCQYPLGRLQFHEFGVGPNSGLAEFCPSSPGPSHQYASSVACPPGNLASAFARPLAGAACPS